MCFCLFFFFFGKYILAIYYTLIHTGVRCNRSKVHPLKVMKLASVMNNQSNGLFVVSGA